MNVLTGFETKPLSWHSSRELDILSIVLNWGLSTIFWLIGIIEHTISPSTL